MTASKLVPAVLRAARRLAKTQSQRKTARDLGVSQTGLRLALGLGKAKRRKRKGKGKRRKHIKAKAGRPIALTKAQRKRVIKRCSAENRKGYRPTALWLKRARQFCRLDLWSHFLIFPPR